MLPLSWPKLQFRENFLKSSPLTPEIVKTESEFTWEIQIEIILQTAYPNSDYDELRILQQDVYKALGWEDPQKESGFKPSDPVRSLKWKMEHVYDVPNDKIVK